MMKCDKVLDLLPQYVEGLLKLSKEREIVEHLSVCSRCKREEMELRKAIELASSLQVEYPDEERWNRFLADLHKRIEEEMLIESLRKSISNRFLPAFEFAALVVLISLLTIVVWVKLPQVRGSMGTGKTTMVERIDIRPYLSALIDKVQMRQIETLADLPTEDESLPEIYIVSDETGTSAIEGGMQTNDEMINMLIGPGLIGPLDYGEIGYEP